MSKVHFDHIAPQTDFERLPIQFVGTTSRTAAVLRLAMLLPAMAILFVPLSFVIAHATGEPPTLAKLTERPFSALQIGIGIIVWCALFVLPVRDVVVRLGARRTVRIENGAVQVADKTPFAETTWSMPLASYTGIAHHMRASLSGLRHELILVHSDPRRNVLLAVGDRIQQSTLDRAKDLLGLPEVPARSLYA